MPAKRKAMRKIKEVLRLKFEAGLSHERIAAAVGVSKGAVTKYVQRAVAAGLGWPLAPERDDAALALHGCSLGVSPLSRLDDPCKIANPITPHPNA
jgi:transcriptional regulator with XRE-family HTH domain